MTKKINYTPDVTVDRTRLQTAHSICPECNTIHPPTSRGHCPMALGIKNQDVKKTEAATNIQKIIYSTEDQAEADLLIEMLNKTIKAWRIKKQKL